MAALFGWIGFLFFWTGIFTFGSGGLALIIIGFFLLAITAE